MYAPIGKFVRIVFSDNSIIQGMVEKWSSEESIILNREKGSRYIIYNVSKNAKLVQIDEELVEVIAAEAAEAEEQEKLRQGYEEAYARDREAWQFIPDEEELVTNDTSVYEQAQLRAKEIAELRIMEAELEREEVKNKLSEPVVRHVESTYQMPDFRCKDAIKYTPKKD